MSRPDGRLVSFGRWLMMRVPIRDQNRQAILGDLDELYHDRRDAGRGFTADVWYLKEVVVAALRLAAHSLLSSGAGISLLDIKLGARMLRKEPMLTTVAILALGIGIPLTLMPAHALFSITAPLPVDEGERLAGIRTWDLETNRRAPGSLHDFEALRRELTTFEAVAASRAEEWNLYSEDGRVEPVSGAVISATAFDILRVPPLLGRPLQAADEVVGAPDVVVIGAPLWESRFGSDPEILGTTIRLGHTPHTVVGVMPESFAFTLFDQLWIPLRDDPADYPGGGGASVEVFGRLADGASMDQAGAEVEAVRQRMATERAGSVGQFQGQVVTMPIWISQSIETITTDPYVYLAQFVFIGLLAIVCGNVGIMVLARTANRSHEIAVRAALGASRGRIVSQLFVEALVLALLATGLGLLVADRYAFRLRPLWREVPPWVDLGIGWQTALLALGLGVVCAGGASVIPALRATGRSVHGTLQRSTGGRTIIGFGAGSTALIVAEVALAVAALSWGATFIGTAFVDTSGEMGIDLERYVAARLRIPNTVPVTGRAVAYSNDLATQLSTTQVELKRRIASEPGVLSVAMTRSLPGTQHARARFRVEGDDLDGAPSFLAFSGTVDVDFFRDMGHPILAGRDFNPDDIPEGPMAHHSAVIVNTRFVDEVLGGRSPIGMRIQRPTRRDDPSPWYEIVGVVGPFGMNWMNPARDAGVYHPAGPGEYYPVNYVIEVGGDAVDFVPRLRALATEVDPTAMIEEPMLLSEVTNGMMAELRFVALAVVFIAGIAVFLPTAGLYALVSCTVAQRTREIGIRTALGARPRNIVVTIARRAVGQLAAGVVLGLAFAAVIMGNEYQQDQLFEHVKAPAVTMVVLATLLVGTLACLVPTLRGLRIQPMETMRTTRVTSHISR
jgi:predicted permease